MYTANVHARFHDHDGSRRKVKDGDWRPRASFCIEERFSYNSFQRWIGTVLEERNINPFVGGLPMDEKALTQYVVDELGKQRNRSDLIMSLCQVTGSSWQQAEDFVSRVESQHHRGIAARQSPYILAIGIGTLIYGMAQTLWVAYRTADGAVYTYYSIPYVGNIVGIGTGIAMVLGASFGIFRVVWSIMK